MSFAFPHYAKIKDNYCFCYLGNASEYVVQLKILRPMIEKQLPGLRTYIACQDSFFYLIEDEPRTLKLSELNDYKSKFAYIREITFTDKHPILQIMEESDLKIEPKINEKSQGLALICPEGINPTRSLKEKELISLLSYAKNQGHQTLLLGSDVHAVLPIEQRPSGRDKLEIIKSAATVMGVENEYLFLAAGMGKFTSLVPTGLGTKLYSLMFPNNKIIY